MGRRWRPPREGLHSRAPAGRRSSLGNPTREPEPWRTSQATGTWTSCRREEVACFMMDELDPRKHHHHGKLS